MQFEIDFCGKLPVSAQEGMERSDANANELWKRVVDGCILAVAKRCQEFTADEVYAEIEQLPNAPSTHNLSALGPRMKEVSKTLGYMKATDRVQRSKRGIKHGNLMRIWQSQVYVSKVN